MGKNNKFAIGTLVERQSRYVMFLHLPGVRDLIVVRDTMIKSILTLPEVTRKTVTWDQGMEMRRHADTTLATGVDIYFCDPSVQTAGSGPLKMGTVRTIGKTMSARKYLGSRSTPDALVAGRDSHL